MVSTLQEKVNSLVNEAQGDENARKELKDVFMGAAARLETPIEACWRMIMSPHAPSALMALLDMGAIDKLVSKKGPVAAAALTPDGGDSLLVVRLMRPLAQLGVVREIDVEVYQSTPISEALYDPILRGGFTFMFNAATYSLANMPEFLRKHEYRNVEGNPGPFQDARKTGLDLFIWLSQENNRKLMNHFGNFMAGQQMTRGDWFDRMLVEEMFLSGAKNGSDQVLLVDIGGGKGHDLQAFHNAFPSAPGKLILQDLPPVIDSIERLDPAIIRQPYDFFTEQPVKGARVYYFRSIMHDWGTEKCVEILKVVAHAMQRSYSKLLLNEFVLPAKDVPLYPSLLDINMMALLNGMERTQKQFVDALDRAGLKVIRFHIDPTGEKEGIIEAELK